MPNRPSPRSRSSHPPRDRTAQPTAPRLHGEVTAALRTLGVAVTPAALDAVLSAAEKESLSHLVFLHRLLAGPAEAKLRRSLERRVRAAKFRELTTLVLEEGHDVRHVEALDDSAEALLRYVQGT